MSVLALTLVLNLSNFQVAESSENSAVKSKPTTPTIVTAANTSSSVLRHIDPLDESRANATHRGKNPHGKLTADQEITVALQHYQEGRQAQAMVVLNQAIIKFPDTAKIYDVRATLELQSNKTKEALASVEKAIQIEPENAIYLVNRSQIYLKFHRQEEALKDLNEAIKLASSAKSVGHW